MAVPGLNLQPGTAVSAVNVGGVLQTVSIFNSMDDNVAFFSTPNGSLLVARLTEIFSVEITTGVQK